MFRRLFCKRDAPRCVFLALLRHQVPDGDLALILGRGLGLLLKDVKRKKFGKTPRPACEPRPVQEKPPSRHVPNSVRREVAERDGESCSYRARNGKVCGSKDFLEYEHRDAWAKHGAHRSKRMRLLCRAHNLLAAEGEFGRAHMDGFARREARGDPASTRSGTSSVAPRLVNEGIGPEPVDSWPPGEPDR